MLKFVAWKYLTLESFLDGSWRVSEQKSISLQKEIDRQDAF